MGRYGLDGRVALVTGAAQGIGLVIAERLAQEGCRLVINDIRAEALGPAREQLAESGYSVETIAGNVVDQGDVRKMFAQIEDHFGGTDILVNNAGIVAKRRWLPRVDDDYFDTVMRVNVKSTFVCSRTAAVSMSRRGGGAVVNLSSVGASRAFRGMVPYVASKGAVEALTRALALDLASYNIRVNAVGPGMTRTQAWDSLPSEAAERRAQVPPLGRPASPSDIANAVVFLVSSDAAYITGQVLYVDGGSLAQCYSPSVEVPDLIEPAPTLYDVDGNSA